MIWYLPYLVGAGAAVGVRVRVGSGLGLVRNCSATPALVRFLRIHQAALVGDGIVKGGYEREQERRHQGEQNTWGGVRVRVHEFQTDKQEKPRDLHLHRPRPPGWRSVGDGVGHVAQGEA
eukprot:scaffold12822_cov55-Phaeocystis_antarctica.AAC.2